MNGHLFKMNTLTDNKKTNISVCVFCSSSDHVAGIYTQTARNLGVSLVAQGMTLVYGGGNNGLMGVLSESVHNIGGRITGVIPSRLNDLGFAYEGADEMIVTDGMRDRKAVMEERADGFIGMPGGFGTLEEMLEIITLRQLKIHEKPVVFLNVNGFFDGLLMQFETGYREFFIDEDCRNLYHVTDSIGDALNYIVKNIENRQGNVSGKMCMETG